jgi:hypothetical protein
MQIAADTEEVRDVSSLRISYGLAGDSARHDKVKMGQARS